MHVQRACASLLTSTPHLWLEALLQLGALELHGGRHQLVLDAAQLEAKEEPGHLQQTLSFMDGVISSFSMLRGQNKPKVGSQAVVNQKMKRLEGSGVSRWVVRDTTAASRCHRQWTAQTGAEQQAGARATPWSWHSLRNDPALPCPLT